jgi:Holliday junction resolvase
MSIKRTDKNQQLISDTFRKLGYKVKDCSSVGKGFPDLIISKTGENILVECKTETGRLTIDQLKFISEWNAAVYICLDADDCVQLDAGLLAPVTLTNEQNKKLLGI